MSTRILSVKVTPPRPRSKTRRFFVRDRSLNYTYRGRVPASVEYAVHNSTGKCAYFKVRDTGGEPEFLDHLGNLGW